jgi:phospholipid/cholesterol/gamma-HCH transport system permease protein
MNPLDWLAALGANTRQMMANWGFAARLFFKLVGMSGAALKRFGLVRDQIHFLGNYSLAIITVSGLFVGFVLGLQGYYTLQRYGSSEALGLLVALSLVRPMALVGTSLGVCLGWFGGGHVGDGGLAVRGLPSAARKRGAGA